MKAMLPNSCRWTGLACGNGRAQRGNTDFPGILSPPPAILGSVDLMLIPCAEERSVGLLAIKALGLRINKSKLLEAMS